MIYRVIGLMSGSSLDGLDVAYVELEETKGNWEYRLLAAECYPYDEYWLDLLKKLHALSAPDYMLAHTAFGHYCGQKVNEFIAAHNLEFKVQLIVSHGHTAFHMPSKRMTGQIGDGAAIAAETGINVVSDLRAMDVALKGQGAPIVPIGEKLLFKDYEFLLNIGGIANLSFKGTDKYIAFDVCPANRVLNLTAQEKGMRFDEGGKLAASGKIIPNIFDALNELAYYHEPYPKSLANSFGTDIIYPMITRTGTPEEVLHTYCEHIAFQVARSVELVKELENFSAPAKMLITGGGAHHHHLTQRIGEHLRTLNVEVVIPSKEIIEFKEAIIMALIGVLRWREENNVLSSVTGATRDSIGGAVWIGQEY